MRDRVVGGVSAAPPRSIDMEGRLESRDMRARYALAAICFQVKGLGFRVQGSGFLECTLLNAWPGRDGCAHTRLRMARLIKSHQNLRIHLLRWSHAVDKKCLPLRSVENHRPLHVETRPPSYVLIHHLCNTPVGSRCARAAAYPSDSAIRAQIRVRKRPVQSWISSALIAPRICLVVVRIGEGSRQGSVG